MNARLKCLQVFCGLAFLGLAWLMAACTPAGSQGSDGTATPAPTPTLSAAILFYSAPCAFSRPLASTLTIECGYVVVPESRGAPGVKTIELHVATIKSTSAHPARDPLILLGGGPGMESMEPLIGLEPWMGRVLAERDIVLFDQRGTGYSRPPLNCDEYLSVCRDRLLDDGVNLAAYTNDENADDVNDLRRALGYDKVNLYGVSYGTLLALTVLRRHPEAVRVVVLDSVLPPQTRIDIEQVRAFESTFNKLFEACAASAECNAAYPKLGDTFYKLVAELNSRPAEVHAPDPRGGDGYQTTVRGTDFARLIWASMQYGTAVPYLPMLIGQTARGDLEPLSRALGITSAQNEMSSDVFSEGMYYSVICSCMIPFEYSWDMRDAVSKLRPELRDAVAWPGYEDCHTWDVPTEDKRDREPVRSDVPTLLFSGEFDPITPPSFAEEAAKTLTQHYSYVFPGTGHGVTGSGDCAWRVMGDFLDNPGAEPDAGCIEQMPGPAFVVEP